MKKKEFRLLLAILTVLLMAVACKKDLDETGTVDRTAPTLTRVNLADQCTGVSAVSSLYFQFSEEMNAETLTVDTSSDTCTGTLQVSDDDFATCLQMLGEPTPDADLKGFTMLPVNKMTYSQTHKVRVTTAASDSAGNPLGSQFQTSTGFTTEADPGIPAFWTEQHGTSRTDYAKGIGLDSAGNIYLSGRTDGAFDTFSNSGGWDVFIVKLNSAGTSVWDVQLGTGLDDYAEGIAVDGDDNIYAAGKTHGTLESGFSKSCSSSCSDAILVKYTSAGGEVWRKQLGSSGDDWAFAVAVDSSDNLYITGKTAGALTGSNLGGTDGFLAKYSKTGVHQWTRQFGTSADDAAYGIAIDSNQDIYLTGHTLGQLGGTSPSGERDIFVVKWNSAGTRLWTHQIGSSQDDYARGIDLDSLDNVLVTGYSYGNFVTTNQGSSDLVVFKLNGSGDLLWKKQDGTNKKDLGKALVIDGSDNIFVAGLTEGSAECKFNRGFSDVLLIRYDSDGSRQWIQQYGSVGLDYGKSMVLDSSNELLLSGWTNGSIDANLSSGEMDLVVFKYDRDGVRQ